MNRSKPSRTAWFAHITALLGVLLPGGPAAAQTVQQRLAHLIEWDLPANADASPGAMVVDSRGDDNNRLWFVTRLGIQRVFRVNPPRSLMKGPAQWTSWELAVDSFTTGGTKRLRASRDRRFVFVRTAESLQRIDTQNCDSTTNPPTCERIEWSDQSGSINVSDLAIDDYSRVFTTAAVGNPTSPDLTQSYVQMLAPGTVPANGQTGNATVTRWTVGGGAGFCADLGRSTTSFPCVSGIAVTPKNSNLVYYSEPEGTDGFGNIGELNISTNNIRRWSLSALPPDEAGAAQQPRQLIVDRWGVVWVITGSGHLVSLDPSTNRMGKHAIPIAVGSDPFGLAPDDDVVGYTDASLSKVGMMLPLGSLFLVSPTPGTAPVTTPSVTVTGERANVASGTVTPQGKVVLAQVTTKTDGVYVEAFVGATGGNDSESPLGITPNKGKAQGTFFYAVGAAGSGVVDRVGFVRLPMVKRLKHPRDDDDTDDGGSDRDHPGWHNSEPGDDDDDGFDNQYDDPTAHENVQVSDSAPLDSGQSADYPMTASPTSLALIAVAEADNPTALLAIDIYNALGVLVASSPTMPGIAAATVLLPAPGDYIARVRNLGLGGITHTPTLIVREPWIP